MDLLITIYGWYGAVAIVLAYLLNSFGVLKAGLAYQLLNLTGAMGVVAVSLQEGAYPPAFLNAVWSLIALVSLYKLKFFPQ